MSTGLCSLYKKSTQGKIHVLNIECVDGVVMIQWGVGGLYHSRNIEFSLMKADSIVDRTLRKLGARGWKTRETELCECGKNFVTSSTNKCSACIKKAAKIAPVAVIPQAPTPSLQPAFPKPAPKVPEKKDEPKRDRFELIELD
jgi:hypothetical protein